MRPRAADVVRAFGVMLGPSAALDLVVARCVASTAGALGRARRPRLGAALVAVTAALYGAAGRSRLLNWGATPEETARSLPGDDLVPDPGTQSTRAVTIEAPVDGVWPWLAQVGQDRAGFYSYEWLENLAGCHMPNAIEVHPEWQQRAVGETVYLHHLHGLSVALFEPKHVLALKGWGAFVVEPLGDRRTRLIARGRTPRGLPVLFGVALMEIPHFVMERKMLLGIKEEAERHAGR
jgi:hypothetical protein